MKKVISTTSVKAANVFFQPLVSSFFLSPFLFLSQRKSDVFNSCLSSSEMKSATTVTGGDGTAYQAIVLRSLLMQMLPLLEQKDLAKLSLTGKVMRGAVDNIRTDIIELTQPVTFESFKKLENCLKTIGFDKGAVPEVRDMMTSLGNSVTADSAIFIQEMAGTLSRLYREQPKGKSFFSTHYVWDLFNTLWRSTSSEVARQAILRNIIAIRENNSETRDTFNIDTVRDMLVTVGRAAQSDDQRDLVLGECLTIFDNNPQVQILLRAATVRDMVVEMGTVAASERTRRNVAKMIHKICDGQSGGLAVFCEPEVRDMLVVLGRAATSDESRRLVASIIKCIARLGGNLNGGGNSIFDTPQVTNMLLRMSIHATSEEEMIEIADALCHVARHSDTPEFLAVVVRMGNAVSSDEGISKVTELIDMACYRNSNAATLLSGADVRNMLIRMGDMNTSETARRGVITALHVVCSSNPNGRLSFSVPDVRAFFLRMGERVASGHEVYHLAEAIGSICLENPIGKALFSTPDVRALLLRLGNSTIQSRSHIKVFIKNMIAKTIGLICGDNPAGIAIFGTPEVLDMLRRMQTQDARDVMRTLDPMPPSACCVLS